MSVSVATEGSTPSIPVSDRTSLLLSSLDADDIKTVEETKALIHESLHLSRDPGLLNALVEYYLKTRSPATLQILSTIHEARTQVLFEKMNECLKLRTSRSDTLTLLGHIVRKQPSWLYKIIKTPLFETLVRCMKGDTDILVLTSGILTITTLLPLVPASIGPWLRDLFDIYTRLCAFRTYRQGNAPEVYHLHLHVAVYLFFHRLYAMYPNNFLVHLRTIYGEPSKQSLFQGTIKPMLEYVRLHPCVVTETTHTETEKHRWRKKEPHDIVIECMKVSLDPVDRIQEDGGFTTSSTSRHSHQEIFADKSISSVLTMSGEMTENHVPDMVRLKERRMSDSATQTGKSLQSGDSGTDSCSIPVISPEEITPGWSPSNLCGLSTPPSSQMSPSTSNPDLLSSLNLYSQCSTPAVMYTPGQSPTTSLGGDVAYLHGPSLLSSAVGSKVKNAVLGWTHSGRGTPVYGGKAASHEGQLTKALYSALAQHSHEEVLSAPAALGGHQTSTPKASERCEEEGAMSDVGRSFEHGNLPTQTSDNVMSTFENKSADIEGGVDVRISEEQVNTDSSHCNKVSPKEEYRDFEEQNNFASGKEDAKSLGSHLSVASSEFSKESVTPVGGQSLDSASLPNTPIQYKGVFDYDCTSIKTKDEGDFASHSHCDFDSSLPCRDHQDQLSITTSDKDQEFPSVNGSETSVATEDTSVDSAVIHGSASVPQQNHHNLHSCDLFASLPQLLPFLKGEQDDAVHSCTGDEGGSLGVRHQGASRASPVEILDDYLKVGSSVHYGELARIPLVSQLGTSWTHFGGEPPVDEVEILRGQVQLLHNQLLFERHKCDLHAVRNRRLIGKTFKAVQYQEELQATKDQLRLQEEKMRELTEALDKQLEDSRRLKEVTSSWDHHQRTELRNLVNANDKVQYTNQELQKKLEAQQKDFDTQQMEVHQFRARVFTLENEREKLKEELSEKDQLTGQVNQLVKELLMMGELNQSQKDTIQKLSLMEGQTPESSMQLHSCHRELSTAKQTVRKQKAELEALTNKLADMESALSNKDIEIRELKKFTEGLKGTYIGKIQSLEAKYSAQKRITQALESYVLDLQSSAPVEGLKKQDKGETLVLEHDAK